MPAAVAIPSIIGGVTSVVQGAIGAHAAHKAAAQQQQATAQAMANSQRLEQQQRQDFSPYQQAGASAVSRLGGMAQAQRPQFQPGGPQTFSSLGQSAPADAGGFGSAMQNIPGQHVAGVATQTPPQQAQMAPQGTSGGMVRVQAPTGEVATMSQQQAQAAVQKGAKVIG